MDYSMQGGAQPGDKTKKIVIIASISVVVLATAVLAVVFARRSQLAPEDVLPPPPVATDGDGGTLSGDATSEPMPAGAVVAGPSAAEDLPKEAIENPEQTVYASGLNRPLTKEEKAAFGWSESVNMWILTSRGTDGETVVKYYDPAAPAPQPDGDQDALPDADEARYGTDPRNPDTDGDGLSDGVEVGLGSDPKKADTDGDGESDYLEFERNGKITADSDGHVAPGAQ